MRVRKTPRFLGRRPGRGAQHDCADSPGSLDIHYFVKWDAGLIAERAVSVETIIDNDPQITAVRQTSE